MKNEMAEKKILILSHNPLSKNQSNGKTILSLFREIKMDNVQQIYLSTDIPNLSLCNALFRICDFDILKKLFYGKEYGKVVKDLDIKNIIYKKKQVIQSNILKYIRSTRWALLSLLRDSIWMLAGYREAKLIEFIEDFSPDFLFFQSSGSLFSFKIAGWICKRFKTELIIQTTDDYLSYYPSINIIKLYYTYLLNNEYKKLAKKAKFIVAIGDELATEYKKKFGGEYFCAMNSVDIEEESNRQLKYNKLKMVYSGNLELGRYEVLEKLAEAITRINFKHGESISLDIYSLTNLSKKLKERINSYNGVRFLGSLDACSIKIIQQNAKYLVHVESFSKNNRRITKYSLSTKLSEYLASTVCILAIGPSDIASIKYLKENDAAIVITEGNVDHIEMKIQEEAMSEKTEKYIKNAKNLAKMRHNVNIIAKAFSEKLFSYI